MQTRWLIGLSSGATVDGVDAALLEAQGTGLDLRLRLAHSAHHP
jgi:1,6-anhydro-N-acetylmuramate kinase